jgi:membrane associated rhomboid family serine protease
MSRFSARGVSYSFGPGPLTPAVKALLIINVGLYVVTIFASRALWAAFGLQPLDVLERGWIWQFVTYLFLHDVDPFHVLFNMLFLWMFGVDLERRWGTRAFTTYYFITGIGAGVCVVLVSLLPFGMTQASQAATTIGASGAVFGLMMAWALLFPERRILFMLLVPIPARVFVLILGAIEFVYAIRALGGGVSAVAHLGGLVVGYLYLKGPTNLRLEWKYRLTKWRMERMRRRFGVHRGGRDDRLH